MRVPHAARGMYDDACSLSRPAHMHALHGSCIAHKVHITGICGA